MMVALYKADCAEPRVYAHMFLFFFFLVLERIVYISGHLLVKKPSLSVLPTSDIQEWCSGYLRKWEVQMVCTREWLQI